MQRTYVITVNCGRRIADHDPPAAISMYKDVGILMTGRTASSM